jgi:hypothetical protein
MARHNDDPRQVDAHLLHEIDSRIIEVIGWLVEQQAPGSAGQDGSHRDPAALPTGQGLDCACAVEKNDTQTFGCEVGAPVGVPGVVVLSPGQRVDVWLLVAASRECSSKALNRADRLVQRSQCLVKDGAHGRAAREARFLREVDEIDRSTNRSAVGLLLTGKHPHQG